MSNEDLISALYPPPPPYFKFFTNENLVKLSQWKEQQLTSEDKQETDVVEDTVAPGELRFLVPPVAPPGTHYRGYGNVWSFEDKLPSLKSSNWKQLYSAENDELITSEIKIKELHKLMDSLLLNFLELIGLMSIDPTSYQAKVKDISLILININHLLNTYRPHQTRESLIMLLRKQIDLKRQEIDKIEKVSLDVSTKINKIASEIATNKLELNESNEQEQVRVKPEMIEKLLSQLN
ncbi:Mediator of RNA polymerase II transcription subunit 7 [Spathaspora sp. JA1]|nr:Mediator of RNA polymerase II transcription subunit 7 [Spathaspora sp. JA1]